MSKDPRVGLDRRHGGSFLGSPNAGSALVSKRAISLIWLPEGEHDQSDRMEDGLGYLPAVPDGTHDEDQMVVRSILRPLRRR